MTRLKNENKMESVDDKEGKRDVPVLYFRATLTKNWTLNLDTDWANFGYVVNGKTSTIKQALNMIGYNLLKGNLFCM